MTGRRGSRARRPSRRRRRPHRWRRSSRRRSPPAAAPRASRSSAARARAACRRPRARAPSRLRRAPCPDRRSRWGGSRPQPLRRLSVSSSSARTTSSPSRISRPSQPSCDEPHEVPALELQRLVVREFGAEDVARPRAPLAVRIGRLLGRLVVDRDLLVELHVVEDGHLVAADDREPPHLVRVEPREVHVRDLPRGEAQVAEDDVLDPLR